MNVCCLDVLTIKMLQETIVELQNENQITICILDHQARDLLACVDVAMILSNGRNIALDSPSNLVKNIKAKDAYFGDSFSLEELMNNSLIIKNKINKFNKTITVSGDKSLSIRWVLLSSSFRRSKADNLLISEDVTAA